MMPSIRPLTPLYLLLLASIFFNLTACAPGTEAIVPTSTPLPTETNTPIPTFSPTSTPDLYDTLPGDTFSPALSADGRYVAFHSFSTDLVSGDTNEVCPSEAGGFYNCSDVFVRDLQMGITTRVSVNSNGEQTNGHSWFAALSADGRYIAFTSEASNLVSRDTNEVRDIFMHDLRMKTTTLISVGLNGAPANGDSWLSAISADGRYVAFDSDASNLVDGDTNDALDVFVRDLQTGSTTRVSVDSNGTQANEASGDPDISSDGRYVVFASGADNLVSGDTNNIWDLFVRDLQTGLTTRVSVDSNGIQANDFSTDSYAISGSGRYVVFESEADNLVSDDTNSWGENVIGDTDIFVHDLQTGHTIRVSVDSNGIQANGVSLNPDISGDGRYVVFESDSSNLVSGDTNEADDLFLHDLQTGVTTRVSVDSNGNQASGASGGDFDLSADGRYVLFSSSANNLVSGDTDDSGFIFLHDLQTGITTLH